jgi:hypothetical protein
MQGVSERKMKFGGLRVWHTFGERRNERRDARIRESRNTGWNGGVGYFRLISSSTGRKAIRSDLGLVGVVAGVWQPLAQQLPILERLPDRAAKAWRMTNSRQPATSVRAMMFWRSGDIVFWLPAMVQAPCASAALF